MGPSCFQVVFVLSALLLLSSARGFGRKMMKTSDNEEYASVVLQESGGETREMIELDYLEAGPNTNTKSGILFPPPPLPQPQA